MPGLHARTAARPALSPGRSHNLLGILSPGGQAQGQCWADEGPLDAERFLSVAWVLRVGARGGEGEAGPPTGSAALSLTHVQGPVRGLMAPVGCGGPGSRGAGTFLGLLLALGVGPRARSCFHGSPGPVPFRLPARRVYVWHTLRSSCGSLWGYSALSPACL